MKRSLYFLPLVIALNCLSAGLLSRFQDPPVTFSMSITNFQVHVTNTSDEVIHAVTVTGSTEKLTVVVADTIEAHKTVTFTPPGNLFPLVFLREFVVTCQSYGSMKVKIPVQ